MAGGGVYRTSPWWSLYVRRPRRAPNVSPSSGAPAAAATAADGAGDLESLPMRSEERASSPDVASE